MMKILGRYLGVTLIKSVLMVLAVFVGLEVFILLATQVGSLGKGSYNLWEALIYILLILPQQTYLLFPMAALIGMLLGLSFLAQHSELIVMRAAGISPRQIAIQVFKTGFILIVVMMFVGEIVGPIAKHYAEKRKMLAVSAGEALKTSKGLWLRQGEDFFYIKTVYSAHHIAEVNRYEFDQHHQLLTASFAKQGYFRHGMWQMLQITQSKISPDHVDAINLEKDTWHLMLDPQLLSISLSQPNEMTLPQLANFINYQQQSHLSATNFQIIFWQRLFAPLSALIMMFLAVPFVFGPLRSSTTGLRLVLGVIIGFAFYLCNQLFPPLSQVFDFSPIVAAFLPLSLFLLIGCLFFKKI